MADGEYKRIRTCYESVKRKSYTLIGSEPDQKMGKIETVDVQSHLQTPMYHHSQISNSMISPYLESSDRILSSDSQQMVVDGNMTLLFDGRSSGNSYDVSMAGYSESDMSAGGSVGTSYINFDNSDPLHQDATGHNDDDINIQGPDSEAGSTHSSSMDPGILLENSVLVSVPESVELENLLDSTTPTVTTNCNDEVVRVVDLIQSTGQNLFRLQTNSDGVVSLVSANLQQEDEHFNVEEDEGHDEGVQLLRVHPFNINASMVEGLLFNTPVTQVRKVQKLPPDCPVWAARLNDCEKIGDSFRGWVEADVDLDLVLTYYKQVTRSYWGTRQTPCQSKSLTRLMWKSQYVPFDGIPFINAGSRAVVMECQYGPRRQSHTKKSSLVENTESKKTFKQSCPARIYIKKVKKFIGFAVDPNLDRKQLKAAMDQAFQALKECGMDSHGEERYYVQLPTEAAHEFHVESAEAAASLEVGQRRLHHKVSEKLREIVAGGETKLYVIRNFLRHFVDKMFEGTDKPQPEKHDLTFYPTVNDLQNHIHQAIRDLEGGQLPTASQDVNFEIDMSQMSEVNTVESNNVLPNTRSSFAQKVTVMLSAKPGGQHTISRVETLLEDGTIQISHSLPPELALVISNMQQRGKGPAETRRKETKNKKVLMNTQQIKTEQECDTSLVNDSLLDHLQASDMDHLRTSDSATSSLVDDIIVHRNESPNDGKMVNGSDAIDNDDNCCHADFTTSMNLSNPVDLDSTYYDDCNASGTNDLYDEFSPFKRRKC